MNEAQRRCNNCRFGDFSGQRVILPGRIGDCTNSDCEFFQWIIYPYDSACKDWREKLIASQEE